MGYWKRVYSGERRVDGITDVPEPGAGSRNGGGDRVEDSVAESQFLDDLFSMSGVPEEDREPAAAEGDVPPWESA